MGAATNLGGGIMWVTQNYRDQQSLEHRRQSQIVKKTKHERADYFKQFTEEFMADRKARRAAVEASTANTLEPWIALLDMNSYFATIEQQANPILRGRPVGVVKEQGRSCIIAASKEAKQFGVRTGMPYKEAIQLCRNLITVPADFDRYFYNTKLLRQIFEELSPDVYIFSLDEAFMDLSACKQLYPNAPVFFDKVRHMVHERLGDWVTFSLGFGANRMQAKLASEFASVDNYFEITPENLDACLAEAKVEEICGIGFRLSEKLHRLGITHVFQLNFVDDAFLQDHFGVFWGPELRRISRGENSHLLHMIDEPPTHMKSVSRSKTLFKATADPEYLNQFLYNLAEDMCFKARRMEMAGQHVGFYLRDIDGNGYGRHVKLKGYVRHTDEIHRIMMQQFNQLKWDQTPIIKAGVWLGDLKPMAEIPLNWLPHWNQQERVSKAVDSVNEKFGLYTVKPARLMNFHIVRPEVTGFLGDRTYQLEYT